MERAYQFWQHEPSGEQFAIRLAVEPEAWKVTGVYGPLPPSQVVVEWLPRYQYADGGELFDRITAREGEYAVIISRLDEQTNSQ